MEGALQPPVQLFRCVSFSREVAYHSRLFLIPFLLARCPTLHLVLLLLMFRHTCSWSSSVLLVLVLLLTDGTDVDKVSYARLWFSISMNNGEVFVTPRKMS